jgi:hypothetical protein
LLALHQHISRALDADIYTPEGHLRMIRAAVDIYSKPLLDPDQAAQARSAIDQIQARRPPGAAKERNDG